MSNPPRPYYDKKTSTKHRFVVVRREGYLTLNQNLPIITNLILLQAPHPSMNEPMPTNDELQNLDKTLKKHRKKIEIRGGEAGGLSHP